MNTSGWPHVADTCVCVMIFACFWLTTQPEPLENIGGTTGLIVIRVFFVRSFNSLDIFLCFCHLLIFLQKNNFFQKIIWKYHS